ncbi:MAG: hypothetical protein N0E54_06270 [Candidatus Thiodiazotropha taylori]|nr:hypothetical protein [Candidatus Thiodiazotropha endolucinida]MCW4228325.1 hypothetical protein [Candidatus Thiodiazotropha taylori]
MKSTILIITLSLIFSGCSNFQHMAVKADQKNLDLAANESLYLMTTTIKNKHVTSHQPKLRAVWTKRMKGGKSEEDIMYLIDEDGSNESDDPAIGSNYMIRMKLEPGNYTIHGLTYRSSSFPVAGARFFAPLLKDLNTKNPGIYYLGHIDAVVRQRNDSNEFKAGPALPAIDQALSGASSGTFDITISNNWESDKQRFFEKFPALRDANTQIAILTQVDRGEINDWWHDTQEQPTDILELTE